MPLAEEGYTQKQIAALLGVGQQTVSDWFKNGSTTGTGNTSKPKPDARMKVPQERKPEIAERSRLMVEQVEAAQEIAKTEASVSRTNGAKRSKRGRKGEGRPKEAASARDVQDRTGIPQATARHSVRPLSVPRALPLFLVRFSDRFPRGNRN